ncbi:MAG: hypothetical protein WDA16_03685 [Candidatus Thermoplasmatota archaeon]
MRSPKLVLPASLLVLVLLAPSALANEITVGQPASHFISVKGDAIAAGAAALNGDTVWYTYQMPQVPQVPCRGEVTYSIYLLDIASGAKHTPIVKPFGNNVGFRSDGPTNAFLAKALGNGELSTVELHLRVECTVPPGGFADVLIATIGVTP